MNDARKKWILFFAALALMAGTFGALTFLTSHLSLGAPGLKVEAIPGKVPVRLQLPVNVLDFTSTNMPEPEVVVGYLPKDTSYAGRFYFTTNGAWANAFLILMGEDRTSIHRPDYCLPGQGWGIRKKSVVNLPIGGAQPYQLPVGVWIVGKNSTTPDGQSQPVSGIYAFWFVADGQVTADYETMNWSSVFNCIRHGIRQRWAYVSYFTACLPGQEDATVARIKALIAASVPEFQLPPDSAK